MLWACRPPTSKRPKFRLASPVGGGWGVGYSSRGCVDRARWCLRCEGAVITFTVNRRAVQMNYIAVKAP